MANPTSTAQWAVYLDIQETSQWLQFSGIPTGGAQTELQRMIDAACTRAQNMAGRPLCPTEFKERFDGWSGEYIQLRYSPFLALVAGVENQSSGGAISLPESTPENRLDGIQIDYATSRIMRTFDGTWPKPFFPGSRNIEITYVAGFNPVPPDVWQATVDLVAYWWRNTQQGSASQVRPAGGGYGEPLQPATGIWPGIPNRIADVFESYRMPSVG